MSQRQPMQPTVPDARSRSRWLVAVAVVVVAVGAAGVAAVVVELGCEPDEACLDDEDMQLLEAIRADELFTAPPPGTTGGTEVLTDACYPSGGWIAFVTWDTTASAADLVDFYRSDVASNWSEVPRSDDPDVLLSFSGQIGDGEAAAPVQATILTDAPALGRDGVLISVHADQLSAACVPGG